MSRPRAALRNVMSRKVTFGVSRGWSGCGEASWLLHPAERRRSAMSSALPKRQGEMVRMKAVMIAENRAASDCGCKVGNSLCQHRKESALFAVSEKRGWHV